MKKQFLLLLVLVLSISFVSVSCKKKDNFKKENDEKVSRELAKNLDFSYFPAKATIIAVVDFQSILNVKVFKSLIDDLAKDIKKESNLDIRKLKSISAFLSVKDLKSNPFSNVAIILDGLNISKVKNFPASIKTEKFEGVNVSVFDDKTGFAYVDKKTIGGTLLSVKNAISLSKGKSKNLASTPRSNDFKDIISKLNGSQVSISFVSNEETESEIKKLANMPKLAMAKSFLDSLKSIAVGLKVDDKNMDFIFVAKSSRDSVESLSTFANLQLKQFSTSMLEAQLKMVEPVITKEGTEVAKNVFSSLRVKASGEYLFVSFTLTVDDAMKISEIFLKLGLMPNKKLK